ncbi:MAG: hypothetical protein ABIL45_04255 [candidate division WOR-3 bacterium]
MMNDKNLNEITKEVQKQLGENVDSSQIENQISQLDAQIKSWGFPDLQTMIICIAKVIDFYNKNMHYLQSRLDESDIEFLKEKINKLQSLNLKGNLDINKAISIITTDFFRISGIITIIVEMLLEDKKQLKELLKHIGDKQLAKYFVNFIKDFKNLLA